MQGIFLLSLFGSLVFYFFLIDYGYISFRRKHWFRFTAVMLYLLFTIAYCYARWTVEKEYCYVDGVWMC